MRLEGLSQRKIPMLQSETETTPYRVVARSLDQLRHREDSVIVRRTELVLSPVLANQGDTEHR